MREFNFGIYLLFTFLMFATIVNYTDAQFWFQAGAFGSEQTEFNNGASVSIQTVWQNVSSGSLGFWVGENIGNGAFIQVGYQIVNATGYYPSSCDQSGCSGNISLTAGRPTWFWEYFPAGYSGSSFYGGIGGDGSAGANGTFNTYSFKSNGDVWNVYFNNQLIGSVDLGTSDSGVNPPTAVGELAASNNNAQQMQKVIFRYLEFYSRKGLYMVPRGFGYISYGKGSETSLPNPYGVREVDSYVDYFEVGSGLPQQNGSVLWSLGYQLRIVSEYGNISSAENYSAYSAALLRAPGIVNISNGTRAVFAGWVGAGPGSYTGSKANVTISMDGNITETVQWNVQYYIDVNSTYKVYGGGWYNRNNTATLYASPAIISLGNGTRAVFERWSSGAKTNSTIISVDKPKTVTAFWTKQYLVNATTEYGAVQGVGWHDENSTVVLQLNETAIPINYNTRFRFYEWSNGYTNSTINFVVSAPMSISAIFRKQYLVDLVPENFYGNVITDVGYYNINGVNTSESSVYLFENKSYSVNYIYYKGVRLPLNYSFDVGSPKTVRLEAPVYNIQISAVSAFGTPVNASINVTFDNGTRVVSYLGGGGSVNFSDVPYGRVSGYVEYAGIEKEIALSGESVRILFITPSLIAVIIVVIVAVVLLGKFARSHYSTPKKS